MTSKHGAIRVFRMLLALAWLAAGGGSGILRGIFGR
jgi:hypothetical protein